MSRNTSLCSLVVVVASAAATPLWARDPATILWAGHLEENGAPVNRTVTLTATFTGEDGAAAGSFDDASLVVVDGNFVFDLVLADVAAPYHAHFVVNGEDFGDQTFTDRWPSAALVDIADEALVAHDASSGTNRGIPGVVPATKAAFSAGALPVAFENIVDVPDAFADGDQGIDLAPSARISFAGNAVSIVDGSIDASRRSGNLVAADFAPGAVANADLQNNTLTNSDFPSTIPLSALAAHALKAGNFSAAQDSTSIFRITNARCANVNALSSQSTCAAVDDCPGLERRDCNGSCGNIVNAICSNTVVGNVVFK